MLAGGGVVRISKGPLLCLALLYFDSVGFDGSRARWFGVPCGGRGLLEFAGHGPGCYLGLPHCLAYFSHGFILHKDDGRITKSSTLKTKRRCSNTDSPRPILSF